jgi:hypothetical protein
MSFIRTENAPRDAMSNVDEYFRAKDERDANAANEAALVTQATSPPKPAEDTKGAAEAAAALRPASPPPAASAPLRAGETETSSTRPSLPRSHTVVASTAGVESLRVAPEALVRSQSQPAATVRRRSSPRLHVEELPYILYRVTSQQSAAKAEQQT